MLRLVSLGMLAALFFSSTFVLNRAMSLEGGHWVWTASLRFGYMTAFLSVWVLLTQGAGRLVRIAAAFQSHWPFWVVAGSIGFGVFYSLLCFSASFAPGWIVATTWQTTILATPLVLMVFGKRVPSRGILLTSIIFVGIALVNIEHGSTVSIREVLGGALPVMVAAFAYPVGNQMVWEAKRGDGRLIPHIDHDILEDSLARVLLLTLGSVPFWIALVLLAAPPPPSPGQWVNTAMVALFSGVVATAIFLHARHRCSHPYEIAAVDATQSMEVVFSLMGEIVFLHGSFPGAMGATGVGLTVLGLVAYTRWQFKS